MSESRGDSLITHALTYARTHAVLEVMEREGLQAHARHVGSESVPRPSYPRPLPVPAPVSSVRLLLVRAASYPNQCAAACKMYAAAPRV